MGTARARTPSASQPAISSARASGSPETTEETGCSRQPARGPPPRARCARAAARRAAAPRPAPPLPASSARAWLRRATTRAASCQREGAGDVGGGDLPLGVADHSGRLDAVVAPEPGEGDHRREQGRLHHLDRSVGAALAQEPRARRSRGRGRAPPRRPRHVRRRRAIAPAARVPSPATGSPGRGRGRRACRCARGRCAGPGGARPAARASRAATSCSRSAAIATARWSELGAGGEGGGDRRPRPARGWRGGGRRGAGRSRAGPPRPWPRAAGGWRVRAGRARPRLPSSSGPARRRRCVAASSRIRWALVPLMPKEETPARRGLPFAGQALRLAQQLDLARLPVDVGGGLIDVQASSAAPVAHRQHHLDHPGDSGCCLGVADVGLDRAQLKRPAWPLSWP